MRSMHCCLGAVIFASIEIGQLIIITFSGDGPIITFFIKDQSPLRGARGRTRAETLLPGLLGSRVHTPVTRLPVV